MAEVSNGTRSQVEIRNFAGHLRARSALLWAVTREEARCEAGVFQAAQSAAYNVRTWDCGAGVCDLAGKAVNRELGLSDPGAAPDPYAQDQGQSGGDIGAVLAKIRERSQGSGERCLWVLRDLPTWFRDPVTLRLVRNLARALPRTARDTAQAIVIMTPSREIPPDLDGHVTVVNWPLPDRAEIGQCLDGCINNLPAAFRDKARPNGDREAAIDAGIGLTYEEAQACYSRSLVTLQRIDPALVAAEKRAIIAKSGVLEWVTPLKGGLGNIGGLDILKPWLVDRADLFGPEARDFGLRAPKGIFLLGVSGCGKSLTAKCVPAAWGDLPLLRFDFGALMSKYVGESQAKIRSALQTIESVGRCVVWIDEIEKALAGSNGAAADGGVAADQLGQFLTWMQDRSGEAFVIVTANDPSALPPEIMRKGRFDEVFFIDLPSRKERAEIVAAAMRAVEPPRDPATVDLGAVAAVTRDFTGAEVAQLVPEGLLAAFRDGKRALSTADLVKAANDCVPLSKTAEDKIRKLRNDWGNGRARRASSLDDGEPSATVDAGPTLEISL